MLETTYTNLREELASYLDRVSNDREIVVVKRKGDRRVAMIPADELSGLIETAHLLRSPAVLSPSSIWYPARVP